jgi:hypothetical protein
VANTKSLKKLTYIVRKVSSGSNYAEDVQKSNNIDIYKVN